MGTKLTSPKARSSITDQNLDSFRLDIASSVFVYTINELADNGEIVGKVSEVIPLNDPVTGKVSNDIAGMKGQFTALINKILQDARSKGLLEAGTDSDDIVDLD